MEVIARNKTCILFFLIFAFVGLLRVCYCFQLPVNTGDVLRHARYGLLVTELGPSVANKPLTAINPDFERVSWAARSFNYPVVTLIFDVVVMFIFPTIFSLKLALTLLEALSAFLVYRHTGEKWLALIYWASPVSIWWTSHEGQFEALQSVFIIGALYLLQKRKNTAWILLFLAIQVKVFAICLVPFFFLSDEDSRPLWKPRNLGLLLAGFAPSIAGAFFYSPLSILRSSLRYNPYHWNIFGKFFLWNPGWLVAADEISTYAAVALLCILMWRTRSRVQYVAPLWFLLLCKVLRNVQFWYMVTLSALLLPLEERRIRFWAFLLVPLLDVSSLIQIVSGPFGFQVGDYYAGMSAFSIIKPFH